MEDEGWRREVENGHCCLTSGVAPLYIYATGSTETSLVVESDFLFDRSMYLTETRKRPISGLAARYPPLTRPAV
jgi:hypothetical protein